MLVEGEEEKFHRGLIFCGYEEKRVIKLGIFGFEGYHHLICSHRLGTCNSTERTVSTYDHFFIWENFSHIKSTKLTGNDCRRSNLDSSYNNLHPKLVRFGDSPSLS